jgi:hypothetical protein
LACAHPELINSEIWWAIPAFRRHVTNLIHGFRKTHNISIAKSE